jgi:putative transcriptional regulator
MKTERFEKMMEGIKWGAEYLKGKAEPSRKHEVSVKVPDVKGIRGKLKVSQSEFAAMLGISVRTIQNWEQKSRVPEGPARVLLEVAASYPDMIREVSQRMAKQKTEQHPDART